MTNITFKDLTEDEGDMFNAMLTDAKTYNLMALIKLEAEKGYIQPEDIERMKEWHNKKLKFYEQIIDKIVLK